MSEGYQIEFDLILLLMKASYAFFLICIKPLNARGYFPPSSVYFIASAFTFWLLASSRLEILVVVKFGLDTLVFNGGIVVVNFGLDRLISFSSSSDISHCLKFIVYLFCSFCF